MTAKGVDVSHWQSLGDWSVTGLSFVIVKASEGTWLDPMYAKHVAKGRAAGLVVGAYAFNRDDVDITSQVATFAAASADADLWFIDVEGVHSFSQAQTRAFIDGFRAATGKHIGLYHSESGYFDVGQDYDWVAHWGVATPTRSWDFHQYRGSPLDLDQFNGTEADLRAFLAKVNSDMNAVSLYVPGYVATVDAGSRVRSDSTLSAPVIRTTTKAEKWTVVGYVTGEAYNGVTDWLCRWATNRWEFTHRVNVIAGPSEEPPTEAECQTFSDAAYIAGAESRQQEIDALSLENSDLHKQVQTLESENAALVISVAELDEENAQLDGQIMGLNEEVTALSEQLESAEVVLSDQATRILEAGKVLATHPAVQAQAILGDTSGV